MFKFIDRMKESVRAWFFERAHGTHARVWLATIAFTESVIFPIPTITIFVAILMAGASRWLYYALFTTFFSVLGGIVGYFIGAFFFEVVGLRIVDFYQLESELAHVRALYEGNAFWVVFTGAFTPLPYKLFTLSAGFLNINFLAFVVASIVGRGLQFFLVGYIFHIFGRKITELVFRYFTVLVFTLLLVAALYFLLK